MISRDTWVFLIGLTIVLLAFIGLGHILEMVL